MVLYLSNIKQILHKLTLFYFTKHLYILFQKAIIFYDTQKCQFMFPNLKSFPTFLNVRNCGTSTKCKIWKPVAIK